MEKLTPKKITKRAAALVGTALLTAACNPTTGGASETPLSLAPLTAQSAKLFPRPVQDDESRIRLLTAQPKGSRLAFFSTAEKVDVNGTPRLVTAGHAIKGTEQYKIDCGKSLKVTVGSLAINSAGTNYNIGETAGSANDVAVLSPKSVAAMKAMPSIPLATVQPKNGDVVYTLGITNQSERVYAPGEVIGKAGDTILVAQTIAKHLVEGNSGGAAVNAQGDQFAVNKDGGSKPLSADEINTTYGSDGVHVSGSGEYYVGWVEPITAGTLGSLAAQQTCTFSP